jgi:hypothetical protein
MVTLPALFARQGPLPEGRGVLVGGLTAAVSVGGTGEGVRVAVGVGCGDKEQARVASTRAAAAVRIERLMPFLLLWAKRILT